jgi:hypothetical protein
MDGRDVSIADTSDDIFRARRALIEGRLAPLMEIRGIGLSRHVS